jgi:hypothetical protein
MRGRREIDALTDQHLHLLGSIPEPLEVRQVRVKIERCHIAQKSQAVEPVFDFDRRRGSIGLGSRV